MSGDPRYAYGKFYVAVHKLKGGQGDIIESLREAFEELVKTSANDMPDHLRDDYQRMRDALTSCEPVGNEGRLEATLSKMNPDFARKIAGQISNLEGRLQDYLG